MNNSKNTTTTTTNENIVVMAAHDDSNNKYTYYYANSVPASSFNDDDDDGEEKEDINYVEQDNKERSMYEEAMNNKFSSVLIFDAIIDNLIPFIDKLKPQYEWLDADLNVGSNRFMCNYCDCNSFALIKQFKQYLQGEHCFNGDKIEYFKKFLNFHQQTNEHKYAISSISVAIDRSPIIVDSPSIEMNNCVVEYNQQYQNETIILSNVNINDIQSTSSTPSSSLLSAKSNTLSSSTLSPISSSSSSSVNNSANYVFLTASTITQSPQLIVKTLVKSPSSPNAVTPCFKDEEIESCLNTSNDIVVVNDDYLLKNINQTSTIINENDTTNRIVDVDQMSFNMVSISPGTSKENKNSSTKRSRKHHHGHHYSVAYYGHFHNDQQYGSILKAINKRKVHIKCPLCVSKVVNMSDHLNKKHNIKDRKERKRHMDTVRRVYLEKNANCETNNQLKRVTQSSSSSIVITKNNNTNNSITQTRQLLNNDTNSGLKARKSIKCTLCRDDKYYVNISDHLIKIHHLITAEQRKPVLKEIKMLIKNNNNQSQQTPVSTISQQSSNNNTFETILIDSEQQNQSCNNNHVTSNTLGSTLNQRNHNKKTNDLRKTLLKRYSKNIRKVKTQQQQQNGCNNSRKRCLNNDENSNSSALLGNLLDTSSSSSSLSTINNNNSNNQASSTTDVIIHTMVEKNLQHHDTNNIYGRFKFEEHNNQHLNTIHHQNEENTVAIINGGDGNQDELKNIDSIMDFNSSQNDTDVNHDDSQEGNNESNINIDEFNNNDNDNNLNTNTNQFSYHNDYLMTNNNSSNTVQNRNFSNSSILITQNEYKSDTNNINHNNNNNLYYHNTNEIDHESISGSIMHHKVLNRLLTIETKMCHTIDSISILRDQLDNCFQQLKLTIDEFQMVKACFSSSNSMSNSSSNSSCSSIGGGGGGGGTSNTTIINSNNITTSNETVNPSSSSIESQLDLINIEQQNNQFGYHQLLNNHHHHHHYHQQQQQQPVYHYHQRNNIQQQPQYIITNQQQQTANDGYQNLPQQPQTLSSFSIAQSTIQANNTPTIIQSQSPTAILATPSPSSLSSSSSSSTSSVTSLNQLNDNTNLRYITNTNPQNGYIIKQQKKQQTNDLTRSNYNCAKFVKKELN